MLYFKILRNGFNKLLQKLALLLQDKIKFYFYNIF